ncbi:MAG TPA: heavy metal sensor histidine kinase [Vicinamibacteria bacterium]|nr:heavy metal sensor histidine kinase [Vicinamibacteria bacterium]
MTSGRPATSESPFRSLRTRITLWYGAIIALCLVAYSAAVGTFFTAHLEAELDRRVHEDVELAARALLVDGQGRPSWAGGLLGKRVDEEEGGGHWIEVWSTQGERLLATGTIDALDLGGAPEAGSHHQARTLVLPVGPVRVMTETVGVGGRRFLVRAALREAAARRQARTLWLELGLVSLAVLGLGGLGGHVLARRSLGPLARMAENARRITAEQLHERLPVERSSAELDQLGEAFNETLARLERSFDQLRRFTADASHELRTPLTALRSVGEVGLRSARSEDEYREVIGSMLEEVDRLSRLADELLMLARAEAGGARLRLEPVDLAALAREMVESLAVLAEERRQLLEARDEGWPLVVQGDRLALRQALLNLVDNAIKYAPEGSCVTVATKAGAGGATLEVRDEGPGIPAEHRERIFERFYRIDKSRSREMGGAGLGLSLVKWAAEAHGGRVELETAEGGGSTFRLVIPRGDVAS